MIKIINKFIYFYKNNNYKKMGGCCTLNKPGEIPEKEEVEVEVEPLNSSYHSYGIHRKKIEKIQSNFRGMRLRKKFKKEFTLPNTSSDVTCETNTHFTKISDKEYEDFLKLYPSLSENNNKIKIKKNIIIDSKELYYGEYDSEKKMKEGRGILVNKDGSKYLGYFKNNKKNIKGKLIHYEGDIYEGEWVDDKATGRGKYFHIDGTTYDGEWENDKQNGFGVETWNDGSYYEGYYVNGKKEGKGIYRWSDGSSYEGDFKDNTITGKGKYIWENKRIYDGEWVNNKMKGYGVFTWPDGRKYKGDYVDDKKEGYGIYYWPDGRIYKGMWKNGLQNGEGEIIEPKLNKKRKGLWKNGKKIKWLE